LISAFTFAAWSAGHIPNQQALMNCERVVRPFAGRYQKYGRQDVFLIFLAFQLCILDTCHAGHGANEISLERLKRHRGLTESTAVKLLQRTLGNTVFSSLSDIRTAFEGYREHGLFTYVLNEGLKGKAAVEKDKIITVHSLAEYMQVELGRLSEEVFKKEYAPITQIGTNFAVGKIK
jgi:hypothetical protein